MAFKDFKDIALVMEEFQITYQESDFLQAGEIAVSPLFLDEWNFSQKHLHIHVSEAAIGEWVLAPILREAYKKHVAQLAFWSHKSIRYDKRLSGAPDYMFAAKSNLGKVVLGRPLLMMVEAKKNDFDEGWGQCLAELVAAQKINGKSEVTLYGLVSDGKSWEFGYLQASQFTKNTKTFQTANLELLFGALDLVLSLASEQIKELPA